MNIKHLNESFKNLYEDNVEDVKYAVDGDLRTALTDAAISLETSGNGNIKAYEDAFQRVLEEFYPDKSWWEITACNIFWSLFEGRNPKLTIDDIINNLIVNETSDDDIDDMYHDYSEDELRKMDAFDNLNEDYDEDDEDFDESLTKNIKVNRNVKGSLEERLNKCLNRLNEDSISPEDQKDSDLIRGMLAKMQNRSNAKFTDEEKAIMKKYGLTRDKYRRNLYVGPNEIELDRAVDKEKGYKWGGGKYVNGDPSKINYADRARKIPQRDDNQLNEPGRHYYRNDDFNAHGGSRGMYNGNLTNREREWQNRNPRITKMKDALRDRKYHKNIIDRADADFDRDSALAKDTYDKQMAYITKRREEAKNGYHKQSFDRYQAEIDKLLKKDKTNSGE